MTEDLQMILTDMPKNLQMISNFSSFSPFFSTYLVFSSYLCTRKSVAPQGLRCYNLQKSIKKRCSPAVRDG